MEDQFRKEKLYLKAQKRVKDIKGFYIHLFVTLMTLPVIICVNLIFTPGFHWFWFASVGMLLGVAFHWFGIFGFSAVLGKGWEDKMIKEYMDNHDKI